MNFNLKNIEELLIQELNISERCLSTIVGGYQNVMFRYDAEDEHYMIRVTSEFHRTKSLLMAEVEFINYLAQNIIPVSKNIKFDEDTCIKTLDLDNIKYYVMKFELVNGYPLNDWSISSGNFKLFENWGRTVGKMHKVAKSYMPTHKRVNWIHDRRYVNKIADRLENQDAVIRENYHKLINKLFSLPIQRDTYGLIHNDLHQGNFFVEDTTIKLFDFDDCAYNWFAYDLAVSFYHAVWTGLSFNHEWKTLPTDFLDHFLNGYAKENYLHQDILEQLPLFLRLREFFLYGMFCSNWDHDDLQDWQSEKLKVLRDNIMNEKIPYLDLVQYNQYFKSYKY
jgi:amicoumacin kinase